MVHIWTRRIFSFQLAHAMGFDQQARAENTVDAVSHLLGDQTIDGYAMVNMGAIQVVNDMVGGVTVTIEDDFTDRDPTLKKGETVTLMGEHAENYIRGRKDVADGSNQNRMSRQSNYEEAFKPAFRSKCAENSKFPAGSLSCNGRLHDDKYQCEEVLPPCNPYVG